MPSKTFQPFKHLLPHLSDPLPETPSTEPAVPEDKLRLLFALLFSSPEAVTLDRIRQVLYPADSVPEGEEEQSLAENFSPQQHLTSLEEWMASRELPLSLHKVGKAWRLLTSEDVADDLISVRRQVHQDRMGPAALEVLSLVAYRQPVLKADIDAVRGVKSGPHLRHLLDMRLVRILGRSELPGRPFLYGTTREFLDRFGLTQLNDLPEAGRLASPAEAPPVPEASAEPADPANPEAAASDSPDSGDANEAAETEGGPSAETPSDNASEPEAVEQSSEVEPELAQDPNPEDDPVRSASASSAGESSPK